MSTQDFREKLGLALLRFDRLEHEKHLNSKSSRPYPYNYYAMGIYLRRADEVAISVCNGADIRSELLTNFNGKLQKYLLKWFKLAPLAKDEYNSVEALKAR